MPLHAFIDFLSWSPGAHRSAGCGLRGGPRRRQGSRPGHYTLPQCPDGGYQPSSAAAAGRPAQAHLWWSEAQSKHGNLLNGPQDEAAAHMAASLDPEKLELAPEKPPLELARIGAAASELQFPKSERTL